MIMFRWSVKGFGNTAEDSFISVLIRKRLMIIQKIVISILIPVYCNVIDAAEIKAALLSNSTMTES
jgi:hypothetical protein